MAFVSIQTFRVLVHMILLLSLFLFTGCTRNIVKEAEVTSYCSCSQCCSWARDFPDFWNRHYVAGADKGRVYTGKTASGTFPREPYDGLFSADTLQSPWKIPHRVLMPWLWMPHDGTIAADTDYYPMGSRIFVPGYGWGRVEDRGSAIKGPERLDIYMDSHEAALKWGRRRVNVAVEE